MVAAARDEGLLVPLRVSSGSAEGKGTRATVGTPPPFHPGSTTVLHEQQQRFEWQRAKSLICGVLLLSSFRSTLRSFQGCAATGTPGKGFQYSRNQLQTHPSALVLCCSACTAPHSSVPPWSNLYPWRTAASMTCLQVRGQSPWQSSQSDWEATRPALGTEVLLVCCGACPNQQTLS